MLHTIQDDDSFYNSLSGTKCTPWEKGTLGNFELSMHIEILVG